MSTYVKEKQGPGDTLDLLEKRTGDAISMTFKPGQKGFYDQRSAWIRFKQERIEASQHPKECPKCGHSPVAKILYGLPDFSPALDASIEAGKTSIGGCCTGSDDPTWKCSKCGQRIWKTGSGLAKLAEELTLWEERLKQIKDNQYLRKK